MCRALMRQFQTADAIALSWALGSMELLWETDGTWAGVSTWYEELTALYISELQVSPESSIEFVKLVISA